MYCAYCLVRYHTIPTKVGTLVWTDTAIEEPDDALSLDDLTTRLRHRCPVRSPRLLRPYFPAVAASFSSP
ncbi:hypothetical protein GW17_00008215 [Ensete ventricosum]|nr:hypothetical protein GW17_00008215 [Ensete ventricosum]